MEKDVKDELVGSVPSLNPKNVILSAMECELVDNSDVNNLIGKLKTLIDACGMPQKQEKSFKDLTSKIVWDWFRFINDYNTDHLLDKIRFYKQFKLENLDLISGKEQSTK
jgi:hypothetical protein